MNKGPQIKWAGMVSCDTYTPEEQEQIRSEAEKLNAYPVFPDGETLKDSIYYYDTVVIPIFHNFVSYKNNLGVRDPELYRAYRSMNKEFIDVVLNIYAKYPQATILFNDPYFLLSPRIVNDILLNSKTAFSRTPHMAYFIHCPFPSYEIFRIFPDAQEFLESILCCDIIGFQVYEYARHFFTLCHRMLGLEAGSRRGGMIGIIYKGRDVVIRVGHVGISTEYIKSVISSEQFRKELEEFKAIANNRLIIASVDKLTPISGIKNKLVSFRKLLREYKSYNGKLVLIQYCTPGIKSVFSEETSKEIKELSKEINKEFPHSVIYDEISVSNEKRLALFRIAEILLITSLRDGFCLLPFEYLLAKDASELSCDCSTGSVILSEFAGCATSMSSICQINPYKVHEIVYSILTTLEQKTSISILGSFQHDVKYIKKHDARNWLESLLKDAKRGHNKNDEVLYLGAIENKILKAGRFFEHLQFSNLQTSYIKAVNRVILLATEGTIFPIVPQTIMNTTNAISSELRQLLEYLCADEKNSVYIVSSKSKEIIDNWFGSIPKLGLCAEYGYFYRPNTEKEWETNLILDEKGWREKVKELFYWYKERTDGSDLEIKHGSIVWTYKECDAELGIWQAKELEKALKPILNEYPEIAIVHGRGFVEVKLKMVEKGESVRMILEDIRKHRGNLDFILSMGDDNPDEGMFRTVDSLYPMDDKQVGRMQKDYSSFTCIVGRKPSYARYYVNDYKEVLTVLQYLEIWSIKSSRNKSMDDSMELNLGPESQYLSPIVVLSSKNNRLKMR